MQVVQTSPFPPLLRKERGIPCRGGVGEGQKQRPGHPPRPSATHLSPCSTRASAGLGGTCVLGRVRDSKPPRVAGPMSEMAILHQLTLSEVTWVLYERDLTSFVWDVLERSNMPS